LREKTAIVDEWAGIKKGICGKQELHIIVPL